MGRREWRAKGRKGRKRRMENDRQGTKPVRKANKTVTGRRRSQMLNKARRQGMKPANAWKGKHDSSNPSRTRRAFLMGCIRRGGDVRPLSGPRPVPANHNTSTHPDSIVAPRQERRTFFSSFSCSVPPSRGGIIAQARTWYKNGRERETPRGRDDVSCQAQRRWIEARHPPRRRENVRWGLEGDGEGSEVGGTKGRRRNETKERKR